MIANDQNFFSCRVLAPLCIFLVVQSGCGSFPVGVLSTTEPRPTEGATVDSTEDQGTMLAADVTAVDAETGLPLSITGTLSGGYEGAYSESILEVFYDSEGMPVVALSRSVFSIEEPVVGTLTSVNTILIVETLIGDDGTGTIVPIGLATGATGEIIHGDGEFDGAVGRLHTDSTLSFATGEFGLGFAETEITFDLVP